jgi:hypothetical protein
LDAFHWSVSASYSDDMDLTTISLAVGALMLVLWLMRTNKSNKKD